MLRFLFVFQLICMSSVLLFAQPQAIFEPDTPEVKQTGEVFFISYTGIGEASIFPINVFLNDELAVRLNSRRYSRHTLEVGKHSFAVQYDGKKRKDRTIVKDIEINPGQKHFLLIIPRNDELFNYRLDAVQISEADATPYIHELREDQEY